MSRIRIGIMIRFKGSKLFEWNMPGYGSIKNAIKRGRTFINSGTYTEIDKPVTSA